MNKNNVKVELTVEEWNALQNRIEKLEIAVENLSKKLDEGIEAVWRLI